MTADSDNLEDLVHLEQTFYDAGYTDGLAHGRIHGLSDGRALGLHHGFTLWEEIGFYEGFARAWAGLCVVPPVAVPVTAAPPGSASSSGSGPGPVACQRATHHVTHLLDLVARFPMVNPPPGTDNNNNDSNAETDTDTDTDLVALQRQIRSRYKALCASLGIRPSLRAGAAGTDDGGDEDGEGQGGTSSAGAKRDVWTFEGRSTTQGLSF